MPTLLSIQGDPSIGARPDVTLFQNLKTVMRFCAQGPPLASHMTTDHQRFIGHFLFV